MTPPPVVCVCWEDAKVKDSGPWAENRDHTYEKHLVFQVGFLLSDTDDGLILTQGWHPELVAARDQIPRGMVRSITYLEPVKTRRRK